MKKWEADEVEEVLGYGGRRAQGGVLTGGDKKAKKNKTQKKAKRKKA